ERLLVDREPMQIDHDGVALIFAEIRGYVYVEIALLMKRPGPNAIVRAMICGVVDHLARDAAVDDRELFAHLFRIGGPIARASFVQRSQTQQDDESQPPESSHDVPLPRGNDLTILPSSFGLTKPPALPQGGTIGKHGRNGCKLCGL